MELRMPAADDFHIHLRNDARTPTAIKAVRQGGVARVLAMPNTVPAIETGKDSIAYRRQMQDQGADFEILTTIKLTPKTKPEEIFEAAQAGVLAAKQYPDGVTTNSENGVRDVCDLFPVYDAMQQVDMVLSIHGEVPGAFVMDAEAEFLSDLIKIHTNFPSLRIVLEHITTKAAVDAVASLSDNVAGTITDHHLAITLDNVVGSRIRPHHFCMPVAKRPEDRKALNLAVKSGNPSFFSGTDSAPHLVKDKESACGCAGIFNSLYHMQFLAHHFNAHDMLDRLAPFVSQFGNGFYRLPANKEEIVLIKRDVTVPEIFEGIVPFNAGRTLSYDLEWV